MDLVILLRRTADDCEDMGRWGVPELASPLRDAAQEIEQLREALQTIRKVASTISVFDIASEALKQSKRKRPLR